MKKFLNFFVLAGILAIVATSCYKEDIQNLQKQIDALKSGEIATIETQISSINTSITELKSVDNILKEYITALQSDGKKYAQQIADLTAMDKTLETKIADLQKYVDSGIKDTKDWASATFATLDQMDSVATVVAKVVVGVKQISENLDSLKKEVTGDYTKAIEAAMTKLETSMKKWVSEQLTDYYTIAQINATLDSLGKKQSDIDSAMVEKIKEQQVALDTAKSQITAAYKKAIKVAIDSLQGKFDVKLATEIASAKSALQTQIDTINSEISNIKTRLTAAENNIAALLAQIQSIAVVPQYSDGSVSCLEGYVDTLSFDIHPFTVAEAIVEAWNDSDSAARANLVSFKIQAVQTKGADSPVATIDTVFFKGDEFKVGVKFQHLPQNPIASLHLSFGKSDVSSSYFLLSKIVYPGSPESKCVKIGNTIWAPVNCGYEPANGEYKGYPYGRMYQWGRKYGQGYKDSSYEDADYPGKVGGSQPKFEITKNADLLTNHPDTTSYNGVFYSISNITTELTINNVWYNGNEPNKLWNANEGTDNPVFKSHYDPCPDGWRVPTKTEFESLLGATTSQEVEDGIHGSSILKGRKFVGNDGDSDNFVFLPYAGYLSTGGNCSNRNFKLYYWSSSIYDGGVKIYILVKAGSSYIVGEEEKRPLGQSVRCVKE